jgi:hypothetical protein
MPFCGFVQAEIVIETTGYHTTMDIMIRGKGKKA